METFVHIGEVKIGHQGAMLSAILGSCIGIVLIDRKHGRCTMSHSLLPYAPESTEGIGGRWVDQAVDSALQLLDATPRDYRRIEAIVAGGGSMMSPLENQKIKIGQANADAAEKTLSAFNISMSACDTGGELGRRIEIAVDTLEYQIHAIPRLSNG